MRKGAVNHQMKNLNDLNTKGLHPINVHSEGYDFEALRESENSLAAYVKINEHDIETLDFSDPLAVKSLNAALLKYHYGINEWSIPNGFLCPPVPGRVDYIHHIADMLGLPSPINSTSKSIRMLDIGTGANGIYALLACKIYGWQCTASDIDTASLENVAAIIAANPTLADRIELRLQNDNSHVFEGVIKEGESYDVSVCNPPFHASLEEAMKGSQKKVANLHRNREKRSKSNAGVTAKPETVLNFGGQKSELWCKGGEIRFLRKMVKESKKFAQQCRWFTSLVSKNENVKPVLKILNKLEAQEVQQIPMRHGNKVTRVLVWRF